MDAKTRAHYVEVSDTQWEAIFRLVHDGSLAPEEKKQAMLAAFAEHDIPINGYLRDGLDWSFVELARRLYCEPLMEIIVERAPNKATEGVHILAECIWSEKCIKILLDRGHVIDPDDHARSLELLRQCAEYAEPGAITLLAGAGMPMNRMIDPYGAALPAIVHAARHGKTRILGGASTSRRRPGVLRFRRRDVRARVRQGRRNASDG